MSRIGKQLLAIPDKVEVTITSLSGEAGVRGVRVAVKGPLGSLTRDFNVNVEITQADKTLSFAPGSASVSSAIWGTVAAHVSNMIEGVTKGFEKKLVIEGIGYRVELSGTNLVFALGFSHPVKLAIPEGLKVKVEKNTFTISGIDKEKLGQFAAVIIAHKKPEPYKGKGIMYEGQKIRRKQGKRSAA